MFVQVRVWFGEAVVGASQTVVTLTIMITAPARAGIFPVFVLIFLFRIDAKGWSEIEPVRILNVAHLQMLQIQ